MDRLQKILENYGILCEYCDAVWERARDAYPNEIACRKGCGICCELQSVNRLEAHIISTHIGNVYNDGALSVEHDESRVPPVIAKQKEDSDSCPFLKSGDQTCLIYEVRPTICRTHGLILRSSGFSESHAPSCPYNFPSLHPRDCPADLTIDIDRVTKNLINLNLAFCMIMGIDIKDESQERIPLRELAFAIR